MKKESWSPHSKIVGMVPSRDEERISLMKSTLHFTDEKAQGLMAREEKIAILDKMFGGSLTPEEIECFLEIE